MREKIKAFLKNSIGYILATFFTIAYIAFSILEINETGKSVLEIIGGSFIFYVFQIVLISLFRSQGITNGKNHETYTNTINLHGTKVEGITDDMDCLPAWCEEKNKLNYQRQRRKILGKAALKYDDYFDKDGEVIKFYEVNKANLKWGRKNRFNRRKEKKRIKAYNNAVNLKLSILDETSVTSSDKSKEDKYALPENEKEFMGRNTLKDLIIKIFPAILFGYYGVSQIANFSWATFVWTTFQALMGFVSAVSQMFAAQNYVINEMRTGIVKKISWIDEFSADIKRNPEKYKDVKDKKNTTDGGDKHEYDEKNESTIS